MWNELNCRHFTSALYAYLVEGPARIVLPVGQIVVWACNQAQLKVNGHFSLVVKVHFSSFCFSLSSPMLSRRICLSWRGLSHSITSNPSRRLTEDYPSCLVGPPQSPHVKIRAGSLQLYRGEHKKNGIIALSK